MAFTILSLLWTSSALACWDLDFPKASIDTTSLRIPARVVATPSFDSAFVTPAFVRARTVGSSAAPPLSRWVRLSLSAAAARLDVESRNLVPSECLPPIPGLTVILPAYNEAERITDTLETYGSYLSTFPFHGGPNNDGGCEILVVDDGSNDRTSEIVEDFVDRSKETGSDEAVRIRCVRMQQNEGKGSALTKGILEVASGSASKSGGSIVLIADADGSGEIESVDRMIESLTEIIAASCNFEGSDDTSSPMAACAFWETPAMIVGNRGYKGSSVHRSVLRWGFRTAVRFICGDLSVQDSQCGFKLLTLTAAERLYSDLNLKRWTHDVEVLYRAKELGMLVGERVVGWEDKDGSKLVTSPGGAVGASLTMLVEVLWMRLEYAFGRWKV